MQNKTTRAFSLSSTLMQRVDQLSTRLLFDNELNLKLQLQLVERPAVDVRGFAAKDYEALQTLAGSTLQGDALLDYALKSPTLRYEAGKFIRAVQKRNMKDFRRQRQAASGSCRPISLSGTVEALLTYALKSLEPIVVRPEDFGGNKGRHAGKAA